MTFEELVTKVMRDEKFRAALKADPEGALKKAGVNVTPQLAAAVKDLNWTSLQKVSDHYKHAEGISC